MGRDGGFVTETTVLAAAAEQPLYLTKRIITKPWVTETALTAS